MSDKPQTAKHTPTPWTIEPPSMGFSQINGADGELIFGLAAGTHTEKRSDEVCEANAAFLVRAVNNHEALYNALLNLSTRCEINGAEKFSDALKQRIAEAKLVLAKARSE